MSDPPVEFIPASITREVTSRVETARSEALERAGTPSDESPEYWEDLFELNAACVLAALGHVQLPSDRVVRYRFFGKYHGDLLVRPFVARATTDVSGVRDILDWHPPPDSAAASRRGPASGDVELLYRHFSFSDSPRGYFEYWIAMQELWASARWIHSRIVPEQSELERLTSAPNWLIDHPVERCEPAIIREPERAAQLAVLLYCPLDRETIAMHRIRIGEDQAVTFVESIPVAHGPAGYRLQ